MTPKSAPSGSAGDVDGPGGGPSLRSRRTAPGRRGRGSRSNTPSGRTRCRRSRCGRFTPLGAPFPATAGKWIGATVGLFATGPATGGRGGVAEIDWFRMGPISS
ncbi:hypothetical protein ACPEIC_44825 [Stenotrophomonas sp. NPDC087984]